MEYYGYQAKSAQVLANRDYYDYLVKALDNARHRVWISMFIANTTVYGDKYFMVRRLVKGLEYAAWRDVDVRVMLGLSDKTRLWVPNATTYNYLESLGIATREFSTASRKTSHSKLAIIDYDLIVAGSHNWSAKSLAGIHNELSLVLHSEDANLALEKEFLTNWNDSRK